MWQLRRYACNILYHVIIVIISLSLNVYLKLLFPSASRNNSPTTRPKAFSYHWKKLHSDLQCIWWPFAKDYLD